MLIQKPPVSKPVSIKRVSSEISYIKHIIEKIRFVFRKRIKVVEVSKKLKRFAI